MGFFSWLRSPDTILIMSSSVSATLLIVGWLHDRKVEKTLRPRDCFGESPPTTLPVARALKKKRRFRGKGNR